MRKVLNHEEADRVPIDLGAAVSTITKNAYYNLKKYLNLEPVEYERIDENWLMATEIDERILQKFDIDFRRVFIGAGENYKRVLSNDGTWTDEIGFVWKYKGIYGEIIYHPIRDAKSINEIKNYKFFDPYDPHRVKGLKDRVEYLYYNTDYSIVAAPAVFGLLETSFWLRGFENFSVDMICRPKWAHTLLRKLTDISLAIMDVYLNIIGKYIDIIFLHDDLGTQQGSFISPKLYEKLIFPYYKELINFIKSKTKAKIFHHSCGAVREMVPLLLEVGIDALNSLQPRAYQMDSTYLKDTYGNRLCFHGGIDIQKIMPYGTTQEVIEEAKRRIAIYAPSGGYIFCCAQNIQDDVQPENIIILYEAGLKYGQYPLSEEIYMIRKTIGHS